MSEDTAPLVVTLKAGTGYDSPWIVVRGDNPDDVAAKLRSLQGVIEATHEAAGLFAASRLGTIVTGTPQDATLAQQPVPPTEQPKQQAWGQTPAAAQQGAAPAQNRYNDVPHPEGKTCTICPEVLVKKKSQGGKEKWQCPQWRWNNGNPNGHAMEWIS